MLKLNHSIRDHRGFAHHLVLPVLAILGVAAIGSYVVSHGHAATPTSYSTITVTSNSKECVDNKRNKRAAFNTVQIYTCNNTAAQRWAVHASTVAGEIISSTGYCLNVYNAGKAIGTPVDIYPCKNSAAQQWTVNSSTGAIINPNSHLCLAYTTPLISTGTPLKLATCNTTAATDQWTIHTNSSSAGGSGSTASGSTSPTDLQVFTGGNNIALVWSMPAAHVQGIQVWRNNVLVATVTPSTASDALLNEQLGDEYDDNSVTAGGTYHYKVRAVLMNGATSSFTPVVSATQPTNSMPVPTIKINASQAPTLTSYLQAKIVPLLDTWYPKIADQLAYPSYTPPKSFNIVLDSAVGKAGDVCYTSASGNSGTISCDPTWLAGNLGGAANAFVHEVTHVVQDGASGPGWSVEGGADWGSKYFSRQFTNNYYPHAGDPLPTYGAAIMIDYMRTHYDTNFPRDVNIAIHDGKYSDSIFSKDSGGKITSPQQAWQATINAYNTSTGAIIGIGGKCVEVQNGVVAEDTKLVLNTCNTQTQRLVTNITFKLGVGNNMCLDDNASTGTKVDNWTCVADAQNEMWTVLANGEVISQASQACLTNQGGVNASGNPVVLSKCTGAASQLWTVGGNYIKNTATDLCLTDPNSSTALATATTVSRCGSSGSQSWRPSGQTTINGDLPQQWALTYHNTSKTGIFEITTPTLGNPISTPYCMDDFEALKTDGTPVDYFSCVSATNEYWTLGANGTIVSANSGTCLSTAGGSSAIGTSLILRACDGSADQKWRVPSP